MIRIQNLSKGYEGVQALKDLSLHVPRGAVYGLVGPNGAGKSTLLRCLSGVSEPDSGTVLIDGQPVWENAPLKARIAYIPDDLYYFTSANLMDMKKFYKDFFPTFDEQLFKKLGDIFPIDPKRPIRHLSKGMQKQAAFWLNLSLQPDLFLLDEPVDGLDPVMRRQIMGLILSDVPNTAPRYWCPAITSGSWRTSATMWASWTRGGCFWSGALKICRAVR